MANTAEEKPDLADAILENAAGPARASGDGQSMEQHPLPDQIEADKYLRKREANKRSPFGLRFAKIVFGGTQ